MNFSFSCLLASANLIKSYGKLLSFSILGIVTVFSLIPLPELPALSNDKVHHTFAYAVIAFPLYFAKPRRMYMLLFAVFVWSGLIELIQPFVNRFGEWFDLAANGLGLIVGIVLAELAHRFVNWLATSNRTRQLNS